MLKIENLNLFYFDTKIIPHRSISGMVTVSINLYIKTDQNIPKIDVDTPFASIIIDNTCRVYHEYKDSDSLVRTLEKMSESYGGKILNLYTDSEYVDVIHGFYERKFHTIIYYIECPIPLEEKEKETDTHFLLIGGYGFNGIISPIRKSPFYTLFNGKFIKLRKPLLTYQMGYQEAVTELVYVFVDIRVKFNIYEFIKDLKSATPVKLDYPMMINHEWHFSWDRRDKGVYLIQSQTKYYVPYEGNEHLFEKPNRNLFHLSDMPHNIVKKMKNTIEMKL